MAGYLKLAAYYILPDPDMHHFKKLLHAWVETCENSSLRKSRYPDFWLFYIKVPQKPCTFDTRAYSTKRN